MTGGPPHNEQKTRRELESPGVRWITFGVISTLHLLIIGGMFLWGCRSTEKLPEKPKEKKYKVKLQAAPPPAPPSEPTVAPPPPKTPPPPKPVVTPQEPVVAPPPPKPQPPKEPVVKPPPKKKPPKEPVVKPPKKKTPTKKVKNKPKKQPPPEPVVVAPPRKKVKTPPKRQTTQNIQKPPKTKVKPKDSGIYQPPTTGKKFDPKGKYNSSPTNRGSKPGAKPSKSTGADDTRENQDWIGKVSVDVYNNWTPPEGVFWGGGKAPQATIELTIAADGRVLSSKLVKPSGNARMDASIREMLRVLTRVTRPPHGGQTIWVELTPE